MKIPFRSRGTSLIEVLVALVVISVGLLGVAKMQALAIASTRTSSVRSLIAIEAASIGSAMHANQGYWQAVASGFSASVHVTSATAWPTITSSDAAMAGSTTNCLTSVCTATQMAAYDIGTWAQALWTLTPTVASSVPTINCSGNPITCVVQIQWTESTVGTNGAYAGTQTPIQTYDLVVQP